MQILFYLKIPMEYGWDCLRIALLTALLTTPHSVPACPLDELSGTDQSTPITLASHFEQDVAQVIRTNLTQQGYKVPPTASAAELVQMSLSLQHRRLPVRPWQIQIAPTAASRSLSPEIQKGFKNFIEEAKAGKNLTPYMSRRIADPQYDDGLFNDWRIYHFHLGQQLEPNGKFIERTNELAFVMAHGDSLYLLDIQPHAGSFTNSDLFEIAHHNWPEILSNYRLKGLQLTPESETVTQDPSLRGKLRKFGINVGYQTTDGTLYMSPGGGFTAAGRSADVTRNRNRFVALMHHAERSIREKEAHFREVIASEKGVVPKVLKIKLLNLSWKQLDLIEEESGVHFELSIGP